MCLSKNMVLNFRGGCQQLDLWNLGQTHHLYWRFHSNMVLKARNFSTSTFFTTGIVVWGSTTLQVLWLFAWSSLTYLLMGHLNFSVKTSWHTAAKRRRAHTIRNWQRVCLVLRAASKIVQMLHGARVILQDSFVNGLKTTAHEKLWAKLSTHCTWSALLTCT